MEDRSFTKYTEPIDKRNIIIPKTRVMASWNFPGCTKIRAEVSNHTLSVQVEYSSDCQSEKHTHIIYRYNYIYDVLKKMIF